MEYVDAEHLTRAEERALFARWRRVDDRDAYDRLCRSMIPYGILMAKRYAHKKGWRNLDDAIGAAMLGVVRAVHYFRPSRGTRLSTYATYSIRTQLQRAHAADNTVRPPYVEGREQRRRLQEKYGSQIERCYRTCSLAAFTASDKLATLGSDPADTQAVARRDESDWLWSLIARLPKRERGVLSARLAGRTLTDIGQERGCTKEWVRQIELIAVRRLRALIAAKNPPAAGD